MGTWEQIVRQMKDDAVEWADGSIEDPERFIRGSADAGLLRILH